MIKETTPEESRKTAKEEKFIENVDYYFENGFMILTAHFLQKRGYCCGNGCRHCPYGKADGPKT